MSEKEDIQTKNEYYYVPYYQMPLDKFFQFGLSVDCVIGLDKVSEDDVNQYTKTP